MAKALLLNSGMKHLKLTPLVFLFFFHLAKAVPVNPNCKFAAANHVDCDLIPDNMSWGQPTGVGIPPNVYVTFTNRTGQYLQINQVTAETGERRSWSEFCLYNNYFATGQNFAGNGETGCSAKNVGEDYAPIRWGAGTGLSVPPGGVIYLTSHTEPQPTNHTYSLYVKPQTTGLHSWRAPQNDAVIACNGQPQSTAWTPWRNNTSHDLHLTGASIYSESGNASSPNSVNVACIYILRADGSVRDANCDGALRTRGEVMLPMQLIHPGESVVAQATNVCPNSALWDWAAFMNVW